MKRLLLLLSFICATTCAFSQAATQTIKGLIIDSAKNQPLGYVTVALQNARTKQPVKSMLSKDNGSFEFSGLPVKAYILNLASIGYKNKTLRVDSNTTINLGRILMSPASKDLKEVQVTALKPLVKQEPDRISYDIQADPDSKALNVLDMLRKMPMVTVDAQDNILLKGNSDYKILINGKPSALVAHNPSDVFKAMPAANIDKIEVITTPPAKYDAEGLAGIINIITKRNADQGYNGTISTRYNTIYGPGENVNATVKQGKFGMVGYFGLSQQRTTSSASDREQLFTSTQSLLTQNSEGSSHANTNYISLELSYEIDSLNLISADVNQFKGGYNNNGSQFSQQVTAAGNVSQSFRSANAGNDDWRGVDATFNYQLGFKKSKQQLLTFSYKYSYSPDKSFSTLNIDNIVDYDIPGYQQYNSSGNKEHTLQVDYAQPFKKVTLETGAKAVLRNNYSDFYSNVLDETTGQYIPDPKQTNNFNYIQDVYGLYNSYQVKFTKWSIRGGLRLEHTNVDAHFISAGSAANQDYNNFIPTISIQRMLKGSSLSWGYTDRISRPGIWQLNPFVDRSNPRFISSGNPDLRPVVYHSLSMNYSKFGKININTGLNFNFANNTIQSLSTLQGDTLTISTYRNIGKTRSLGLNTNISYPANTNLNLSVNLYTSYIWLNGFFNGLQYENHGAQGNIFFNASYKIGTWRVGVNAYAYTPNISLQYRSGSYVASAYSISKDLLNKKLSISAIAQNPYSKYWHYTSNTNSPDYTQVSHNRNYYRYFNFTVSYKFGRLNSSIKKNQHGINNDDTSGGKSSN